LLCVAVCCSVLQCVAVCCSVLQTLVYPTRCECVVSRMNEKCLTYTDLFLRLFSFIQKFPSETFHFHTQFSWMSNVSHNKWNLCKKRKVTSEMCLWVRNVSHTLISFNFSDGQSSTDLCKLCQCCSVLHCGAVWCSASVVQGGGWMGHVAYEGVVSHMNNWHHTDVNVFHLLQYLWMSHEWVVPHMNNWRHTHMNVFHMLQYSWMNHLWVLLRINDSRHTHECLSSATVLMNESRMSSATYQRFASYSWMSFNFADRLKPLKEVWICQCYISWQ